MATGGWRVKTRTCGRLLPDYTARGLKISQHSQITREPGVAATASDGTRFDVVGIGNAIVDVLAHAEDAILEKLGLVKGAMTLVDASAAETLYAHMAAAIECSGGCAAIIGKVKRDQLGEVFAHDIRALGVHFATPPAVFGAATARCLVFITPDAQRTMQNFLGACVELGPEDIDEALIAPPRSPISK